MNTSKNLWKATDFQIKSTRKSGTDKMNFFKKSKLLLLLVSASLIFSSCGKQADLSLEADAETYNTGAEMRIEDLKAEPKKESQKKIAEADMETIEPPEDGWTLEELNQVLYMNGQKIELPLMFSSLKEGYEIKDKQYSNEATSNRNVVGKLYYGNEFVAIVTFNELKKDIIISTLLFETSYYEKSQNPAEYIILNGLRLNDDTSKIEECLGKGFIMKKNIYKYCLENEKQYIMVNPNKKGYMIMINVRGEDKND